MDSLVVKHGNLPTAQVYNVVEVSEGIQQQIKARGSDTTVCVFIMVVDLKCIIM